MTVDLEQANVKPIESEDWWSKLSPKEQSEMRAVDTEIEPAIRSYRENRTTIGRCLHEAHRILKPHGLFYAFMRRRFQFSRSTGIRIFNDYQKTASTVPEPIIVQAVKMGVDMSERNIAAAVLKFPPPKRASAKKAAQWLTKVATAPVEPREMVPEVNEERLLFRAVTAAKRSLARVPDSRKARVAVKLCGMVLSLAGVSKATTIKPVTVPAAWTVPQGRPRLPKKAA